MLSYVLMDPQSAMNSQRVYAERQYDNGYINYRTGSYLDEIIEYEGERTSSAPWYNWINAELFKTTRDTAFLREMYASGKAFYQFYTQNRDKDGDGLCEWGGHAVLESVRDAAVAVWDEVGWPAEFEGVDVNSMLVMEARSLEFMARSLGLDAEADRWQSDYQQRSARIREVFWDETTGFYYNADKTDNDFSYRLPDDLKRREIIGFLPLWAGIADSLTAKRVIGTYLLDPEEFWRPYGVPTLSARDPYYNSRGYWNGPVWVEWNLFLVQALLQYGYPEEARQLVDKLAAGMIAQLKANNNLWEFYSPDEPWAGYHKTYIWAAIINRMLLDAYGTID
jgi:glycogen debranching enzyme